LLSTLGPGGKYQNWQVARNVIRANEPDPALRAPLMATAMETTMVSIDRNAPPAPDALLTWYQMKFELPAKPAGISAPWHLHLEANGNGFIYVNGHCIGRYWEAGPQHDFFLPDCWLNFGSGSANGIALDLRPVDKGVSLQAASVVPDASFAVETPLAAQ